MKFDLVLEETDFSCAAEWTAHQEAIIKGLMSVDPFNPVNPVKLFSVVNYCNHRNDEASSIRHPETSVVKAGRFSSTVIFPGDGNRSCLYSYLGEQIRLGFSVVGRNAILSKC